MAHTQEGSFTLIRGDQRDGKTLLMSIFALQAHQHDRPVFTNLAYTFPRTTEQTVGWEPLFFLELNLNNPSVLDRIRNSVITLDEFWMILDSRSGMSKDQKAFTRFLYQVKKQGIDLFGTTHDLHLVDRRARENFDYLMDVRAYPRHHQRPEGVPPEYLKITITNGPLRSPFKKVIKIKCRPFLGLYDTSNTFDPLEPPEGYTRPKQTRPNYAEKITRHETQSQTFSQIGKGSPFSFS